MQRRARMLFVPPYEHPWPASRWMCTGDELEVDIRVRSEDLPDVLIRTPVDAPISESVRPQLSGGRLVYVHPVIEQVSRHE
jgi:hypothetical protein